MARNSRRREKENTYWKSITDAMSGLLLILLLILMLFMVRIISLDELGVHDYEYEGVEEVDQDRDDWDDENSLDTEDTSSGGGNENPEETIPEDELVGEYELASILVQIVDEDSEKIIQEKGVSFHLLDVNRKEMTLHTYYPEKVNYDTFETEPNGSFYLPERIARGVYILQNITPPKGYRSVADTTFVVDKFYDWSDPLVVKVYTGPEKNSILIQQVDSEGKKVSVNAKYNIYAKDDISAGGKLRYHKDELVDTIICDGKGYGRSISLYLGEYCIESQFEESGYANIPNQEVSVDLLGDEVVNEVVCQKTTISIQLSDEQDYGKVMSGALFEVTNDKDNNVQTLTTDDSGMAYLDNLDKNVTYTIRQTKGLEHYQLDENSYSFYVDENGYIDGSATSSLHCTNRIIRVDVKVVHQFLRSAISDKEVDIYNQNNQKVYSYISSSQSELIEGLEPGTYRIVVGDKEKSFVVKDSAEIQKVSISLQSGLDLGVLIGGISCLLGGIVLFILKRKK